MHQPAKPLDSRRFSAKALQQRLRSLRTSRALTRADRRRSKVARELWAALDAEGLFEPLNREERRLWDKLVRRGQLNHWYARRLHQVNRAWMIPYLPQLLAENGKRGS